MTTRHDHNSQKEKLKTRAHKPDFSNLLQLLSLRPLQFSFLGDDVGVETVISVARWMMAQTLCYLTGKPEHDRGILGFGFSNITSIKPRRSEGF